MYLYNLLYLTHTICHMPNFLCVWVGVCKYNGMHLLGRPAFFFFFFFFFFFQGILNLLVDVKMSFNDIPEF